MLLYMMLILNNKDIEIYKNHKLNKIGAGKYSLSFKYA